MVNDNIFTKAEWDTIINNILRNKKDGAWGEYKLIKVTGIGEPHYITNIYCLMKTRGKDEYHLICFEISRSSLEITDSGRVWGGCYDDSTLKDVFHKRLIDSDEYCQLKRRFYKDNIIG